MAEKDSSGWILAAILGAVLGGLVIYTIDRSRIRRVEAENHELIVRVNNLNRTVQTKTGHIESLEGYISDKDRLIATLESQSVSRSEDFDWIIKEMQMVASQIDDLRIRQLISQLIERAKNRKAGRIITKVS